MLLARDWKRQVPMLLALEILKRAYKESEMMLSAKDKSLVPQGTLSSYSFILLGTFHMRMEFSLSSFVIAVTLIPGPWSTT